MIQLTEQKHFGKRFLLTENNYSFKEILTQTNTALGKKPPYINAGKGLLVAAKWLDRLRCFFTGNEPVITSETIVSGLEKNTYDNTRIRKEINFSFKPLSETLQFVCASFLNDIKQ
jgi:dihydroflavonol-4-reductase